MNIKELTDKDIGKLVTYKTTYKTEHGRIKSWNDKFIFVVYKCNDDWNNYKNYTGAATKPEELEFGWNNEDNT